MQFRFSFVAIYGLIGSTIAGCAGSTPPPVESTEAAEKPKTDELKNFEGSWLLKSRLESSGPGTYSLNPGEGGDLVFRIHEGVMEMRVGDAPWVKYATLTIGAEPQSLLSSRLDPLGQEKVQIIRYKFEGKTLILVQDNLYPDILPDSCDLQTGGDRGRQINTYERIEN